MERLERVRPMFAQDLDEVAAKMTQDTFVRFKCSFGGEAFVPEDLRLPVPGLASNFDSLDTGIKDSKLILKVDEIRRIFDQQIDALFSLIDQQPQIVQSRFPYEMINYLILFGGLSSSAYVQRRVRDRYEHVIEPKFRNARNMKMLVASEPQLAVVHGLVLARAQAYRTGTEFLAQRCSPVSYGIVCREPYDPKRHQGQMIVQDEHDKRLWAADQIAWIVKKGDVFSVNQGASQFYQMKLGIGEDRVPWKMRIAMSTLAVDRLPKTIKDAGAKIACEVKFALNARDFRMKNARWYQLKAPYLTGEFEVRLILGTGLKFEVWSKDRLLSKGHEEIRVDWVQASGIPSFTAAKDGSRMYRVQQSS
ncbi:Hypothetical predicted protein [Lecanosticta acicola]|uniref:Uncharacterized protein n=1 Tax=Lecanosticta acicola TaxID=111012 RepID=A0AAI8W2M4_9PEZI|nr:Hypothetical predicted protein [Lecanosticta acicola]